MTKNLDKAVSNDDVAMVSLWIARGEKPNERVLNWAASEGHGDLLVEIHEKWPALIATHHSILDSAIRCNQVKVIAQLLTLQPTLLVARRDSWVWAARAGRDDVLNLVLSHNPPPLVDLCRGYTALTEAAGRGHESTVALLLQYQPDLIHKVDKQEHKTALHFAAEKGNLNIVKQLLDRKPELIDMVSSSGSTILHCVANTEVIGYLLDRKPALSDAVDGDGQNALHMAAQLGHGEAFHKLLAQSPRSLDVLTKNNRNTLHFAGMGCDPQVLNTVLSRRPEFACGVDISGNTPLHYLCRHAQYKINPDCELESCLDKLWQSNPSALQAKSRSSQTPLLEANMNPNWGAEFFARKLSWDEMSQYYQHVKVPFGTSLEPKIQRSRTFAEEQLGLSLSSALFVPGVLDIVKEYFFIIPRHGKTLREQEDDDELATFA